MEITFLGHSSFRIKSKNTVIITDPFDPDKVGLKFPKTNADIVTVSHDHFDHNNTALVSDVRKIVAGPGEYEIAGVSILGYSTYHDEKKGEERGKNTVYVFEMEGMRIAHMGDLGHKLSENEVEKLGSIDIMLLPVGGFFTIGPEEASFVAKSVEPSVIIPMHYKIGGMNESFDKLVGVDDFLKEVSLPVERMDKYTFKDSEFTEDQKVVVLNTK